MVSANSVQTYREFIEPNLKGLKKEIFDIVKCYPKGISIFEVAEKLGKPPHSISGRFSDLVKLDLIILSGEFKKIPHSHNPETNHGLWIVKEKIKVDKDGQSNLF